MCTNLVQGALTPSGLSRFDSTRNLAQTLYWKKLCQSSKLQLGLLCQDVDAFKPCALQVSHLCITLLMVYERTGFTREPSLIADGSTVKGVVDFGFWGEALTCFHLHTASIYPNVLLISPPLLRLVKIVAQ